MDLEANANDCVHVLYIYMFNNGIRINGGIIV